MKDFWQTTFIVPLTEFIREVGSFLPHLLTMVVVLTVGVLAAWVIKVAVFRFLKTIKFDQFCNRTGFSQALTKGGIREGPSATIGRVVYWALFLVFLMLGLRALQLTPVNQFVTQVLGYLPHLLVALVIVIVGFLLGNFFARAALIAAVNAQIAEARYLARAVRLVTVIFALAMAFEQLGIAKTVIVAAFSITLGGVVLAIAIAFGLGARDTAKALIERRLHKDQEPEAREKEEDFSHI